MRYSSAVVLSTIVVGQAAAAHLHNRHASFHARRQAEAKRSADNQVDWSKVAYDLSDVDWNKVFASPSASPSASASPSPAPAAQQAAEPKAKAAEAPASSPSPTQAPASSPSPTPSKAPATSTSSSSGESIGDLIDDLVGDFVNGLESLITNIGAKTGKNPTTNENGIWISKESKWRAQFTNDHSKDVVLFCWRSNNYSNMCINSAQPEISVGLKSGESVDISFAENANAACAPVYSDTKLAMFGGVNNTWFEVTFGAQGAFDISRNVNMNGNSISAKGSKCTSDMSTCVFKCKNGMDSCEQGSDYYLENCASTNGGGSGYDVVMAGVGGGCSMGSDGEVIKVVLS